MYIQMCILHYTTTTVCMFTFVQGSLFKLSSNFLQSLSGSFSAASSPNLASMYTVVIDAFVSIFTITMYIPSQRPEFHSFGNVRQTFFRNFLMFLKLSSVAVFILGWPSLMKTPLKFQVHKIFCIFHSFFCRRLNFPFTWGKFKQIYRIRFSIVRTSQNIFFCFSRQWSENEKIY